MATVPSAERRLSYERMAEHGAGSPSFRSDVATISAASAAAGYPVTNLQTFSDLSLGPAYRSTTDAAGQYVEWDFGAATTLNWCLLAGVRGILTAASFSGATAVELYAGAAPNPAGLVSGFYADPLRGDLWLTFDGVAAARYWRVRFNGASNGLGFYEIKRAALGTFVTFPTNFKVDFSQEVTDRSEIYSNAWQDQVVRFQPPTRKFHANFEFIGSDTDDFTRWRDFIGYAAEPHRDQAPQVPLWIAPDPAGGVTGPSAEWLAPRFAYLSGVPRQQHDARTQENLFTMSLDLSEVT